MQRRVDDLDSRVGRIDRIVSNQSLVQLAQQVDTLQKDMRGLQGRVEELQNENATLRREQRDLYAISQAPQARRLSRGCHAGAAAMTSV